MQSHADLPVLVAEDDPINRRVIARQLALLGYPAELVDDGETALLRWREHRHPLVLSDLGMPRLDGLAFVRALRQEEGPQRRSRVLALTGRVGEDELALQAGFDAVLMKPIGLQALGEVLQRWSAAQAPEPEPEGVLLDAEAMPRMMGVDRATARELLAGFLPVMHTQAQELLSALAERDRHQLSARAHKLKSSARAVGAESLGQLCELLERCDAGQDAEWMQLKHTRLDALLARTEAAIRAELAAGGAGA